MNIEKADDKVSCISLRWLISLDGSEVVCSVCVAPLLGGGWRS